MTFTIEEAGDGSVVIRRDNEVFVILPSRYESIELFNALSGFISTRKA